MEKRDTAELKKLQESLVGGYQALATIYGRMAIKLLALDRGAQDVFKTIPADDGMTLEELSKKLPYHIDVLRNTVEDMTEMDVLYQECRKDGSVEYKINKRSHFPIVEFTGRVL